MAETVTVSATGDHLTIRFLDGAQHRFHAVWLRDNALDASSRGAQDGRRLISLSDVPVDIRIQTATALNGAIEVSFAPEEKTLAFPSQWLKRNAYDYDKTGGFYLPEGAQPWDNSRHYPASAPVLAARPNTAYAQHQQHNSFRRFGFVKRLEHSSCPFDLQQTQAESSAKACCNSPQTPHSGKTYLTEMPELKIFYNLENKSKAANILLVDGFRIAERLRDNNPRGFDLLAGHPARFEQQSTGGKRQHARRPMINIAPDGQLVGLRFDNRCIAPIVDVPFDQLTAYYAAYRQLTALIHDPAMAVPVSLNAGEALILDNKRVLHAVSDAKNQQIQAIYTGVETVFTIPTTEENWVEAAE